MVKRKLLKKISLIIILFLLCFFQESKSENSNCIKIPISCTLAYCEPYFNKETGKIEYNWCNHCDYITQCEENKYVLED